MLQVEACKAGRLYVVNVVGQDGATVISEVAFNSDTGCIGANTVKVRSYQLFPSLPASKCSQMSNSKFVFGVQGLGFSHSSLTPC